MPMTAQAAQQLYVAYFNRPADTIGLAYWMTKDAAAASAAFSVSAEYVATYAGMSNAQIVNAIYTNLFGRGAEPAGLTYWGAALSAGTVSVSNAVTAIAAGAQGTDKVAYDSKVTAATAFTAALDTSAEIIGYSGVGANNAAKAWMNTITDAATATAASSATVLNASIATVVAAGTVTTAAASAIDLTTRADTIVGTVGNDLIDGSRLIAGGTTADTWGNADSINGGGGTDTLFAQMNASITPASLTNVEVLSVEAQAAVTIDLNSGDASLTTIKSMNSGANLLTVSNLQSVPTSFVLSNVTGGLTASIANSKLTGTSDATTVDLSNVTAGTITLQTVTAAGGFETVTVNSGGSVANTATLTDGNGTSLTRVNITGSQELSLTLSDTTVTTFDGSAATNKLTMTAAATNGQNMTITGGSAADVITVNGYTTADIINGGAGTDRLVITNAEAVAATAVQTNVTLIETIQLSDGLNGAVNIANFNATGIRFGANMGGASSIDYAAGTSLLDLQNRVGAATTVNIAGVATTDVLNVTYGSSTAAGAFGANAITINGAETVNVTIATAAGAFGSTFAITDTAASQTLNVLGAFGATFTGAVRADAINASAMTGAATLTLTGGTGTTATTITGTANDDVLNGSTVGDIINGGSGNDTIANVVTGTATTGGDVLSGGAGFDTYVIRGSSAVQTGVALSTVLSATSQIADFTVGSTVATSDILSLSATAANYSIATATGLHAGIAAATGVAAGATIIQTVAQNAAAAALVTGADLFKLTTGVATTGLTVQQAFNAAIGSGTITGLGAGTEGLVSMYDTTNGRMLLMVVDAAGGGTNTIVETADVVELIGSVVMSAADYANFGANNFSLIAA